MSKDGFVPASDALPTGWVKTTLDEICLPVPTTRPDERPDVEFIYIDISSIDRASKTIATPQRLLGRDAPSRARQVVRAGDVLVSTVRPNLRAIARVPEELDGQIASTGFCVLRPASGVATDFLFHAVLEELFQRRVQRKARGVSYPAVREDDILQEALLLPPEEEQVRIAALIDRQMERIGSGLDGLGEAELAIDCLRAAVLAAAVSGRLVGTDATDEPASALLAKILEERRAAWEHKEIERLQATGNAPKDDLWKTRYKEPAEPAPEEALLELPERWSWASVSQLSLLVQYGTSAKTHESGTIPVLRMGNIVQGHLSLDDVKFLHEEHPEFPDLLLEPGDVLFNRTNSAELVGKAAIYDGEPDPCSFASYLIRVRLSGRVRPELLVYFLSSPYGRAWVKSVASQQVGQANVNGTKLKALTIPLPPSRTQEKLCESTAAYVDTIDALRRSLVEARRYADGLKQSLLQRALAGELLPQLPTDEPADSLLDRVRSEKAALPKESRVRKRRAVLSAR